VTARRAHRHDILNEEPMSPPAPSDRETLLTTLGIEITEATKERVVARMPVGPKVHQPFGLLHGGASLALAETVASVAAWMNVGQATQIVVGIEINANHVRGVREGWVHGTARPLHVGRTTQLWEIRVVDDAARLVCASRLTIGVVPRPPVR